MILDADFKEVDHSLNADFGVVFNVGRGGKGDVDYSLVANALKGNASGSAVALTDISPLEHVIGVKAKVINLYDESTYPLTSGYIRYDIGTVVEHTNYICTKDYVPCGDLQGKTITINKHNSGGTYVGLAWYDENKAYISGVQGAGGYVALTVPNNAVYLRFTVDTGTSEVQLELGTTSTPYKPFADISTAKVQRYGKNFAQINSATLPADNGKILFEGKVTGDFVFSFTNNLTGGVEGAALVAFTINGNIQTVATSTAQLYRISGTLTRIKIVNYGSAIGSMDNIQLEVGTVKPAGDNRYTKTEYEPYTEPTTYDISADGAVESVTSLYPTTTLTSDTEGIVLDVEYNRDINKAFAELVNALISLGGNV